jgi:uncharacterized membrane protein YdjX (TVP38/TMEM64 family)
MTSPVDQPAESVVVRGPPWVRLGALVAVTVAFVLLARASGLTSHLRPAEIRGHMASAGAWGPVAFVAAFTLGELAHVPGVVFVAAAVVAYGRTVGIPLAYVGALVSLSVSFAFVRVIGGRALSAIRWGFVRRMLLELDTHPVRTVALLRLVLWMTPQLNYALALSNLRFRSYFLGSAVGLALPVVGLSFLFDRFLSP